MLTRRNEQGLQHWHFFWQKIYAYSPAYKWNTIKIHISLKWIQKHNVPKTNVNLLHQFIKKGF